MYTRYSGTYKITEREIQKERDLNNLDLSWSELLAKYPELQSEMDREMDQAYNCKGYPAWIFFDND